MSCGICTQNDSFNWCSFQDVPPVQSTAFDKSDGAYHAVLPQGVKLWKKREITVAFTYATIHLLGKWKLEVDDILKRANQWHELQKEPNYIPKFKSTQSVKGADIIVELNGNSTLSKLWLPPINNIIIWTEKGINKSFPGIAGKIGSTEPTMWLDLSLKNDNYNEHLVVHEFGHALGLGHEHQRSDFQACIAYFLDETKMSKKLQGRYKDWSTDVKLDINGATEYDPESVMHYWLVGLIYACQLYDCNTVT